MFDDGLPRVAVVLPGGRRITGWLYARRQTATGWSYAVMLEVPAGSVAPIDGEGYDNVPVLRVTPPAETSWLVQRLPGNRLDLHTNACWIPNKRAAQVQRGEAEAMIAEGRADGSCTVCHPVRGMAAGTAKPSSEPQGQ